MLLNDDLVSCWWEYQRLLRGTYEERKALEAGHPATIYARWNNVNARITRGGPPALDLVSALLRAAPDEDGITLVAAGPLEDLLRKHASTLIADIEHLAHSDERFRRALGGVWLTRGSLSPEVQQRLSQWTTLG